MFDQRRSRLQEHLLHLYLRLNGYFVTGFIVHSPEPGRNRTEIDALAIRHPYHDELERIIRPSPYLDPSSEYIDLLICEVKSRRQSLHFNEALRTSDKAIASVLRWSGLFRNSELSDIVVRLKPLLQPTKLPGQEIPQVIHETPFITASDGMRMRIRIRPVLCSPERWEKRNNQPWFIPGSEIFNFVYDCFCPEIPRSSCSTRYDFGVWGEVYEPIVRFFKDSGRHSGIEDLYEHLGITRRPEHSVPGGCAHDPPPESD